MSASDDQAEKEVTYIGKIDQDYYKLLQPFLLNEASFNRNFTF